MATCVVKGADLERLIQSAIPQIRKDQEWITLTLSDQVDPQLDVLVDVAGGTARISSLVRRQGPDATSSRDHESVCVEVHAKHLVSLASFRMPEAVVAFLKGGVIVTQTSKGMDVQTYLKPRRRR